MEIIETLSYLPFIAVALFVWLRFFLPAFPLAKYKRTRVWWAAFLLLCFSLIFIVLKKWSAPSVRSDWGETVFYLVLSMIWVTVATSALSFFGLSIREDVSKRKNAAAGLAAGGFLFAVACCAACSNIGDGPGPEAVFFCMFVSTTGLLVLWTAFDKISRIADAITVDRQISAGILAGGWFAGTGMVLGGSVAGDWVSFDATVADFLKYSLPMIVLTLLVALLLRVLNRRPQQRRDELWRAAVMAAALVVFCGAYAGWVVRQ
jgi:hypothetical protein